MQISEERGGGGGGTAAGGGGSMRRWRGKGGGASVSDPLHPTDLSRNQFERVDGMLVTLRHFNFNASGHFRSTLLTSGRHLMASN